MNKEKIAYILEYSSHLMNDDEALAWRHYSSLFKQNKNDISELSEKTRKAYLKIGWITEDPSVLSLLNNGIEVFRDNTAKRILADNGENIVFNYCPKCKKLTRTPRAKQCRYCGHDWH